MRHTLFDNLSWLPNDCVLDLKLLTSGNPILSNEQDEIIFKHVFEKRDLKGLYLSNSVNVIFTFFYFSLFFIYV